MRVCVLHFLDLNNQKEKKTVENLSKGAEKAGHNVTILNGYKDMDNVKLPIYEYVFIVIKQKGIFSSKIDDKISEVLGKSGNVIGMKSAALVLQNGLNGFAEKACARLMKAMEKEGMFVNNFSVLSNADHATYFGKKLC